MNLISKPNTDDLRIKEIKELVPPSHVFREFPVGVQAAQTTHSARQAIHRILHGADDRLLVIIGPCSIHDVEQAMEYARKLQAEVPRFEKDLRFAPIDDTPDLTVDNADPAMLRSRPN